MFGNVSGEVDDILDNGTQSSAVYSSFDGCLTLADSVLPEHTQNIVSDQRKLKYQLIGIEFSWREPFNAHICLDFTMKLLTLTVGMIKIDYLIIAVAEIYPKYI